MKQITQITKDVAAKGSTAVSNNELPTIAGAVPPTLAAQFRSVPAPSLPEVIRLPRPRERCPLTGTSRTWLIEQDMALPSAEKFIFRVRQRGKMRGAVFVNVERLLSFMRKAQAQEVTL